VIIRLSGILAALGLVAGVTAGAFAQSMSSSMGTSAPKKVVVHYLCSGLKVTAYYDNVKKHVSFIYGDHHYQLPQMPAASGVRYVGKGLEWWEKGPNVTLSSVDPGQTTGDTVLANCVANK
jgi:membrane-bound inhibitor of C-type lysozyme